jgi:hypothetical protein
MPSSREAGKAGSVPQNENCLRPRPWHDTRIRPARIAWRIGGLRMTTSTAQDRLRVMGGLLGKGLVVFFGYVLAVITAWALVEIFDALTTKPDDLAYSGMLAGGDLLLFLGAFGFLAVIPTIATFLFFRSYPLFWSILSISSLVIAATGVAGLGLYIMNPSPTSGLAIWASLFVLRVFLAPGLAVGMIIAALFSPHRRPRFIFLSAAIGECTVCVYVLVHWFLPLLHS